ncbi:MAG: hypothetical protein ACI30H_05230 [Paludibacteraceae bacterium]
MANRRHLKKSIQGITSELVGETYIAYGLLQKIDHSAWLQLLQRIAALNNEFLARANHPEPGNVKGFYKQLRADFDAEVAQILNELEKQ